MPRVRTTKSLAKRIDLQYFTRRDNFRRGRLWLSITLPVIAAGWLVYTAVFGTRSIYTKGRLSDAHMVLSTNCNLCHQRTATYRAGVPDKACLGCHDAPAHNARQMFTPACSSCHVEHVGKTRLSETADSGCTQCHANLRTTDGKYLVDANITNFDKKHPEFIPLRSGQSDPGTINLNHYKHLQPTIRGPQDQQVQMVCDDCHRPTNSQEPWRYSVAVVQPASQQPVPVGVSNAQQRKRRSVEAGAGAYMTGIKYVNQCAACHLLQFDRLIPEPAPHDKPDVVHQFILAKYSAYIAAHPEALRMSVGAIVSGIPAGSTQSILSPSGGAVVLATSPSDWVQRRTAEAERLLWNKNCNVCHIQTEHLGEGLPDSVKAVITTRWLPNAEFDHEAHRMLTCVACHANIRNSRKTSDINLPGIALCRECHKEAGAARQAAEGRCFECHSYHDWRKERRVTGIMDIAQP